MVTELWDRHRPKSAAAEDDQIHERRTGRQSQMSGRNRINELETDCEGGAGDKKNIPVTSSMPYSTDDSVQTERFVVARAGRARKSRPAEDDRYSNSNGLPPTSLTREFQFTLSGQAGYFFTARLLHSVMERTSIVPRR